MQSATCTLGNVPEGDDIDLKLKVNHADYAPDRFERHVPFEENSLAHDTAVPSGDISLALLRKQAASIVMHRGFPVAGTVRDSQGKPIAGAVVSWKISGDKIDGETPAQKARHEVRTDAHGDYRIPAVPPDVVRVTATAKGYAPATRLINVTPKNARLDFQLEVDSSKK